MSELQEGLDELNIKPETIRFVVCATRDLLEDAAFDVEAWLLRKVSEGMRAASGFATGRVRSSRYLMRHRASETRCHPHLAHAAVLLEHTRSPIEKA